MKMRIDTGGALPSRPDFDMLRAGLAAAQATTPTAQASERARPDIDPAEALVRMFAQAAGLGSGSAALRGSFKPDLATPDERGEQR